MTGKRKRTRHSASDNDQKRQKISKPPPASGNSKDPTIKQTLLSQYYPQVLTLREYLFQRLPNTSKIRRKKILSVGRNPSEEGLSAFLDSTLVGVSVCTEVSQEERWHQWTTFSQRADESASTFINLSSPGVFSQSEIVDFAIWLLFSKKYASIGRVQHLLCQGFQKDVSSRAMRQEQNHISTIPGVQSVYPNIHVTSMKSRPWPQVLLLMGKEGERAMIDLILECGIFLEVGNGRGVYHQLCGLPLGELQTLSAEQTPAKAPVLRFKQIKVVNHSPSAITLVRNRIFYARAALNAKGDVRFGLRHIHVLNRYPLGPATSDAPSSTEQSTIHVMMYLFPRQFGLHNVFSSEVDSKKTVQPFMDYTLREDEINEKYPPATPPKIPKRLRGKAAQLVRKLQVLHNRCSYKELIDYYCPVVDGVPRFPIPKSQPEPSNESSIQLKSQMTPSTISTMVSTLKSKETAPRKPSMMNYATPEPMVSAFCRAVLLKLVPKEFWGTGDVQTHNEKTFLKNVDRFIGLRRFESLTLHDVSQGLQISDIEWLQPPNTAGTKMSQSDLKKRLEIFHDFIYYIFDSLLIPLLRANFHITESGIHKYRLFYFRHDVWRSLAEPAIAALKLNMFEEVKLEQARKLLDSRTLGFSQVRLLPKETGVRPIMNLKRRTIKKSWKNTLGPSINSVLAPVYNIFSYEKTTNPTRLGSTLWSVGDLYTKLKAFKSTLTPSSPPLYFAKVDVQAAFDTIPQSAILSLMRTLPTESEYLISKHAEFKAPFSASSKPTRKFPALAHPLDDCQSFAEILSSDLAVGRKNTVFVPNIVPQVRDTDALLSLLEEHVQRNIVKIGKKFFRQAAGIPQGSVLSSLLCNYFYADLEDTHLSFLQNVDSGDNLLMRLTDDFLLVTTNRSHAKQFLQIMHDGVPAYGVKVNPDKTLVNFEVTVNEKKIKRLVGTNSFPYCGSFVDTKTLDITKDRERRKDVSIADSMTVEFSKIPGKTFHRKILTHAMFLDTSYNALPTVLRNIHSAFVETATKTWTYIRLLPAGKRPRTALLKKTILDTINLAFVLMKSKGKNGRRNLGYTCKVSKVMVEWLAMHAFGKVLRKRQSGYGE
ncbi:Telomerase reverse transcriptase, partial [Lachnellula occidentalis]